MMFGRPKKDPKPRQILDVVAVTGSNKGTLEVVHGRDRFRRGDTLRIDKVRRGRDGHADEMTVKIIRNGRVDHAGTLKVLSGTFDRAQGLRVEAVNAVPVS